MDPVKQLLTNDRAFGYSIESLVNADKKTNTELDNVRKRLRYLSRRATADQEETISSDEERRLKRGRQQLKDTYDTIGDRIHLLNRQDTQKSNAAGIVDGDGDDDNDSE